uniref:hypothetical protein n=1 Tax=Pontiella sp. TaxID=2837462 RepID=UPI00356151A7
MNTQRMKFGCLRGAPILTALLTIAVLLSTPQARASIDMTLNLDRQNDAFSPSLSLYASGASDPVTYHRVESPNAIFYRTVGSQNTSSYVNQTYSAMISECTAGLWTLTTNVGDPSEEVYSFSVSITGLSEGLFGDTSVTNPGSFEVVSTNQPLIEWTSTSLFPEIHIQVHNGVQPPEPGNFYTAPAPFNSWTPPSPVLGGTNYIYLAYQTNDFAGITISTPTNGGGGTVSNWTATADLSSYDFSAFVVPGICTDPFNIAVECPGFSWYTDEYEPWIVSTADYTVGPSSLQSTADTNGYSYLEATVQGPATVTFDWALFGSYGDYIEFYSYDNETGTDEDFFYYEGYESFGWDTYTVTLSS